MRKVYGELKIKVILNLEEGVSIKEAMDQANYDFWLNDEIDNAEVVDTEFIDFEITDSK